MAGASQARTRHKEHSLSLAALAGRLLLWMNAATGLATLLLLNVAAIVCSAFSVVRHADVLATISVTVSAVAFTAIFTGQPLVMGLEIPDILLMLATFLVCQTSLTGENQRAQRGRPCGAVHGICDAAVRVGAGKIVVEANKESKQGSALLSFLDGFDPKK